jgi:hypothetical protein
VCARCDKERMVNEAHMPQGEMLTREISTGCGTTAAETVGAGRNC